MILVLSDRQSESISSTKELLDTRGFRTYMVPTSRGNVCTVLDVNDSDVEKIQYLHHDIKFLENECPYILGSKYIKDTKTVISLDGNAAIGGSGLCVIAGPCSVESEEQMMETARLVKSAGASILRGGAFKPRTSPYAFQGKGVEGLKLLKNAGDAYHMPVITEVMDADDLPVIAEYSDIVQVGARNCQNFSLLKKLGKIAKPVLLKRGMMMTIEEFLMSAEYVLSGGNMNVILCERGIRTFETETRNTLDISAVPVLQQRTHLPIIVDPSHAAGNWKLIHPLALASVAAGADGLMIEVHPHPETALCDGKQSLRPDKFETLMNDVKSLAAAVGRFVH